MPAKAGTQNSLRRRWLTAYAPLIIWIVIVLGLGTGVGSMDETSLIIRPLLEFLFPNTAPETITIYHGYIRKFAHLAEYAVLALLGLRAFVSSAIPIVARSAFLLSLALVVAIALTDETLQSMQPTRTSSPYDVLIDITGGILALALVYLLRRKKQ